GVAGHPGRHDGGRAERQADTPAGEDVVVQFIGLAAEIPAERHPQCAEGGQDEPASGRIENGGVDDVHVTASFWLVSCAGWRGGAPPTDETVLKAPVGARHAGECENISVKVLYSSGMRHVFLRAPLTISSAVARNTTAPTTKNRIARSIG